MPRLYAHCVSQLRLTFILALLSLQEIDAGVEEVAEAGVVVRAPMSLADVPTCGHHQLVETGC